MRNVSVEEVGFQRGSDGNMHGVSRFRLWYRTGTDQVCRKLSRCVGDVQEVDTLKDRQSFLSRIRVARTTFLSNQLRGKELKTRCKMFPPIACQRLTGSDDGLGDNTSPRAKPSASNSAGSKPPIAKSPLAQRILQDMQLAGLGERTQESYLRAVRQLAAFVHLSPDQITEKQPGSYFQYLKNQKAFAPGWLDNGFISACVAVYSTPSAARSAILATPSAPY